MMHGEVPRGDDGLTDGQREALAREWRRLEGSPFNLSQLHELDDVIAEFGIDLTDAGDRP